MSLRLIQVRPAIEVEITATTIETELRFVAGFAGLTGRDGKLFATFYENTRPEDALEGIRKIGRAIFRGAA